MLRRAKHRCELPCFHPDPTTDIKYLFTGEGEVYLYSGSRLGSYTSGVSTRGDRPGDVQYFNNFDYNRRLKTYEFTNHLGNATKLPIVHSIAF